MPNIVMSQRNEISEETKFFIELAKQGKNAWNKWRDLHPQTFDIKTAKYTNRVSFKGAFLCDLDSHSDFSGFNFGSDADFSDCSFFDGEVTFEGASFSRFANFSNCDFGRYARFDSCQFHGEVDFYNSKFEQLDFESVYAPGKVQFNQVIFEGEANFSKSRFEKLKIFQSTFERDVNFRDTNFGTESRIEFTTFKQLASFEVTLDSNQHQIKRLPCLDFTVFLGEAILRGRSLNTTMLDCRFQTLPDFTSTFDTDLSDLTNAEFPFLQKIHDAKAKLDSTLDLAKIRALRRIAEQSLCAELESDLNIFERKCNLEISKSNLVGANSNHERFSAFLSNVEFALISILDLGYKIISNYGKSLFRPPLIWFASLIGFSNIYNRIMFKNVWSHMLEIAKTLNKDQIVTPETYNRIAQASNLANNLPIVGQLSLDNDMKKVLFCGYIPKQSELCVPPHFYDLTLVIQNIFVGLLIFLFGLAIRNYFKIK